MLMHGAFLLAIGLFTSSLTENQFVALVVTYAFVVPFYLLELVVGLLGSPLDEILAAAAATAGLKRAALGVIDSHYVVLWTLLVFAFLFLCGRVLDSGRWR
jgi:ABC-2 type transport system permease protein